MSGENWSYHFNRGLLTDAYCISHKSNIHAVIVLQDKS